MDVEDVDVVEGVMLVEVEEVDEVVGVLLVLVEVEEEVVVAWPGRVSERKAQNGSWSTYQSSGL